jgi:hypothetical protein
MDLRHCLFLSAVCMVLASCSSDDKKPSVNHAATNKTVLMPPFRFHKAVEVSPGQTYDVVSWGRGSTAVGSFAILHSDSAGMKYTTTTGDLDGTITDVYNADMDTDGNPEILIQSKGKDTVNYAKIYAFEFNDNTANNLDFPKLTNSQKKGYRGDDNFYIKDGKLIREFPIYDGNNKAAKPTGAKRQLEYSLRSNDFTVKQLSKDSTVVSDNKPVVNEEPKKVEKHKKKKRSHRG